MEVAGHNERRSWLALLRPRAAPVDIREQSRNGGFGDRPLLVGQRHEGIALTIAARFPPVPLAVVNRGQVVLVEQVSPRS